MRIFGFWRRHGMNRTKMTSKDHPTATNTTPYSTRRQSGRFGSEQVAAFRRNQWPLSSECASRLQERAPHLSNKWGAPQSYTNREREMPENKQQLNTLLNSPLHVINVGLEEFAQNLKDRGVSVVHVDWSPPAGGNPKLAALLAKLSE